MVVLSNKPLRLTVAAYQTPLLPLASMEAIGLVEKRVRECERIGAEVLCCPEAVLGGLADDVEPSSLPAITCDALSLPALLAPLASDTVTTIIGFNERGGSGQLYNSAAVFSHRAVLGIYRKHHPALRRSRYAAGQEAPVFRIGAFTFGVLICNDSNFPEPATELCARGASVLFIPTNNALAPRHDGAKVAQSARAADIARATENAVWIVRADVTGKRPGRECHGSSGIVGPDGTVHRSAKPWQEDLITAEIEIAPVVS